MAADDKWADHWTGRTMQAASAGIGNTARGFVSIELMAADGNTIARSFYDLDGAEALLALLADAVAKARTIKGEKTQ
jgi:hypothetical protein